MFLFCTISSSVLLKYIWSFIINYECSISHCWLHVSVFRKWSWKWSWNLVCFTEWWHFGIEFYSCTGIFVCSCGDMLQYLIPFVLCSFLNLVVSLLDPFFSSFGFLDLISQLIANNFEFKFKSYPAVVNLKHDKTMLEMRIWRIV